MTDEGEFNRHLVRQLCAGQRDEIGLLDSVFIRVRESGNAETCCFTARGEIRNDLGVRTRGNGIDCDKIVKSFFDVHF